MAWMKGIDGDFGLGCGMVRVRWRRLTLPGAVNILAAAQGNPLSWRSLCAGLTGLAGRLVELLLR